MRIRHDSLEGPNRQNGGSNNFPTLHGEDQGEKPPKNKFDSAEPREAEDTVLFSDPRFNGPVQHWSKNRCRRLYKFQSTQNIKPPAT